MSFINLTILGLILYGRGDSVVLNGIVKDTLTGTPLPYVIINLPEEEKQFITRIDGKFTIHLQKKDSILLTFTRIGYKIKRKVIKLHSATLFLEILLVPEVIKLKEVIVTALRIPYEVKKLPCDYEIIKPSPAKENVSEAISGLSDVFVSNYGDLALPAIRGALSNHVLVLIDGKRLNLPQTGVFDLSLLDVSNVRRIEIVKGSMSSIYASNAIGGVINIITKKPFANSFAIALQYGSFDRKGLRLTGAKKFNNFGTLVQFKSFRSQNRFTYRDEFGQKRIRENADKNEVGCLCKLGIISKLARRECYTEITAKYLEREKGVPGRIGFPSLHARMEEKDAIISIDFKMRNLKTSLFHHYNYLKFDDPDAVVPIHTYHINSVSGASGLVYLNAGKLKFEESLEILNESVSSKDIGKKARISLNASSSIHSNGKNWLIVSTLGVNYSQRVVVLPKIEASVYNKYMTFYCNIGRAFRLPTFNELYWPEDAFAKGNPNLKPEYSVGIEGGIRIYPQKSVINSKLSIFLNRVENLIQWQPGYMGKWTPENLSEVFIRGAECAIMLNVLSQRLTCSYTYLVPKCKNYDLIYRPRHKASLEFSMNYKNLSNILEISYTGKRYITVANTKYLAPYVICNTCITCTLFRRFKLSFEVRNIFNQSYEVMAGYPMPGREYRAMIIFGEN